MSLFGDEEPVAINAASKSRSSLFDDDDSPAPSKSSLFADDDGPTSSPWGMPTPKKAGRAELIRSLLPASDVPDFYIDTFDKVVSEDGSGGKITAAGVAKLLSAGSLGADEQSRIMSIISSGGQSDFSGLGRNEFNVLLALIGLAQENEDLTLDSVDERRKKLPIPELPSLFGIIPATTELAAKPPQRPTNSSPVTEPAIISPQKTRAARKESIDFPEADPWGSPALHKNHNHQTTSPKVNGASRDIMSTPVRTTSGFTTRIRGESSSNGTSQPPVDPQPTSDGWGSSYDANPSTPFGNPSPGSGGGFAPSGGGERPTSNVPSRSIGSRATTSSVEENIVITLLAEKEGIFMFQHHNYQVASARRGSKVIRRYSDFVWLLDCLQKRYPFRQLPLLPPKRVGVNGNHLAADNTFIEKRRRGLVRFANALVRHPVLSQEQLVIMFLTVPTELSVWRKQANLSVQEEFTGRPLPPGLEDSLSPTLNDLFDRTRVGVRRSADIYINLCNLMDRLAKRTEGLAADHLRISLSFQSLMDASEDTYATDTNEVPLLNEGLNATAKHMSNSQSLLEDEAKAWDLGVLEDLKKQRDALVSVRDMFDRRERYDKDNIPALERRIQSNEAKLVAIRSKPSELIKPDEIEKVTRAIISDKESIVAQHARSVFVKECIRDELIYFQNSQTHVGRLGRDFAQERVKYSEMQADNWRQLHEELEGITLGE